MILKKRCILRSSIFNNCYIFYGNVHYSSFSTEMLYRLHQICFISLLQHCVTIIWTILRIFLGIPSQILLVTNKRNFRIFLGNVFQKAVVCPWLNWQTSNLTESVTKGLVLYFSMCCASSLGQYIVHPFLNRNMICRNPILEPYQW